MTCTKRAVFRTASDSMLMHFAFQKDQARVMRRMQRCLKGSYHGSQLDENSHAVTSNASEAHKKESDGEVRMLTRKIGIAHDAPEFDSPSTTKKKKTSEAEAEATIQLTALIKGAVIRCIETGSLPRGLELPQIMVQRVTQKTRDKLKAIEGQLDYTSSVAFAIAAAIKRRPSTQSSEAEEEPGSELAKAISIFSKLDVELRATHSPLERVPLSRYPSQKVAQVHLGS